MASEQENGWLMEASSLALRVSVLNMPRWCARLGGVLLGLAMCLCPARLEGVITRLTPLKEVLAGEKFIFVAKIEKIDPDNQTVLFKVDENLKGKPSFGKIPLNLTGDREGQKEKHPAAMLKRLAPGISVIVFASPNKQNTRYSAFGFTEGTWFQMIGQVDKEDATVVRWSFTHCEPYLRRTFKGTTAELRKVIIDGLEGKKPPPEPDAKEQPGLGPEIKSGDSPKDPPLQENSKSEARNPKQIQSTKSKIQNKPLICHGFEISPLWAVIPTFSFVGPLALLAALFPAVFGGLALVFKRWRSLLWVASLNSTLYLLHSWFAGSIKEYWWGKPAANWMI
ncbi:MAG TPA: hypothetical protein VGY77_09505, partial [Gemmataceae bacterium]|nr:hypothetical protein [Gemmataceae bacterium]